jgi:hypothetical protein
MYYKYDLLLILLFIIIKRFFISINVIFGTISNSINNTKLIINNNREAVQTREVYCLYYSI